MCLSSTGPVGFRLVSGRPARSGWPSPGSPLSCRYCAPAVPLLPLGSAPGAPHAVPGDGRPASAPGTVPMWPAGAAEIGWARACWAAVAALTVRGIPPRSQVADGALCRPWGHCARPDARCRRGPPSLASSGGPRRARHGVAVACGWCVSPLAPCGGGAGGGAYHAASDANERTNERNERNGRIPSRPPGWPPDQPPDWPLDQDSATRQGGNTLATAGTAGRNSGPDSTANAVIVLLLSCPTIVSALSALVDRDYQGPGKGGSLGGRIMTCLVPPRVIPTCQKCL
jgi:hypothetical protein